MKARTTFRVITAACVLLCAVGSAAADSIVLAQTGGVPPSGNIMPEPNGLYVDFTVPVLNYRGQIAFQSDLEGTIWGEVSNTAIFRVDSEEGKLIVQGYIPLPSWKGRFKSFYSPAINYMGQVAFWADNTSFGRTGIYCGTGEAIPTQVVRENEPSPDGNGRFDEISKYQRPLDIMGNVAFRASLKDTAGGASDDTAIVLTLGSVPKLVAREGSEEPITTNVGYYMNFPSYERVALSEFSEVAFRASIDFPNWDHPMSAIISGRSSLHLLASEGQSAPGGGWFSIFGSQPSIHQGQPDDTPTVAFHAFLQNTPGGVGDDDIGLYRCAGYTFPDIHEIARRGNSPPDGNGQYDLFGTEISLNDNVAAFRATMRNTGTPGLDGDGIYRYYHAGDITETVKIARGGDPAPGGNGVLYHLYQPVINYGGQVAFQATLWGTAGGVNDNEAIYVGDGLILMEVARKGDPLLGSTITSLHFATGPDSLNGFNDNCQVAYKANLADGRQALLLATPLVQYIGDSSGGWPDNANWTLGIDPAAVHDVLITPSRSVEVAGPRTDATVKSLMIGSAAGGSPATLSLVSGGDVTAVNTCTIMPTGTVEIGDGRTLAAADIVNQGALTFQPGTGNVFGEVANDPGGTILVPGGAQAWMHGQVHNQGIIDVAAGAGIHLSGLTGNGSSGGGTAWLGGEVRPGTSIGLMNFGGDVVFDVHSTTYIELAPCAAVPTFDQIVVEGDLMLNGALVLDSACTPAWMTPGQRLEIIDVMGTATGRFLGLDQGAQVAIFDGLPLYITYAGGDGNDVELYAVPEPSTLVLAAMGLLAFGWRRRRNPARLGPGVTVMMLSVGAGLLLCALPAPAGAMIYNFTEIANNQGQPFYYIPYASKPSINESGMVAFLAELTNGADGIFVGDGATPSTIATTSELFTGLWNPSINDAGDVAFLAWAPDPEIVRFDAATSTFTTIADNAGLFNVFSIYVSINNAGTVVFEGHLDSGLQAMAVSTGGPPAYVALAPGYNFKVLGAPVISTGGSTLEVAFWARETDDDETIVKGATFSQVSVAETSGPFSTLTRYPSINDAAEVLFSATLDNGGGGVYTGDGNSITTVADSVGPFDGFHSVAHSNTGSAFLASLDFGGGGWGIFTGPDVVKDKVIAPGDTLQGFPSTVHIVDLGPEALNNSGQLVMHVLFYDGRQSIIRADPFGELMSVPDGLNAAVAIKTYWQAGLGRAIDNPSGQADLAFTYRFPTTTGQLLVKLGDVTLATVPAPRTLTHDFTTVEIPVDVLSLFPDLPPTLELEFILEGGGELSGVLIDDITFPGLLNGDFGTGDLRGWEIDAPEGSAVGVAAPPVPEPATLALLGLGGLAMLKRRRK